MYFFFLGLDGEISVDMGQCRQSCSTKRTKINRREFEAILKANYSADPVEVFIVSFSNFFKRLFFIRKTKCKVYEIVCWNFIPYSYSWPCNVTFHPSHAATTHIVYLLEP